MRLDYASGKELFSPGAYGIRLFRHFAVQRRISIGKNVPIANTETARPSMSLLRNAIALANRAVCSMSIVLNSDASSSRTVFTVRSLAAAIELAIERTAKPFGAAGIIGGPGTINGGLFTLGFLGFFGGFGCAHRTSGPMIWVFGRRPLCGTRPGETFVFVETLGITFDYTRK